MSVTIRETQPSRADRLLARLETLNEIGVALSRETDVLRLMETILVAAKTITGADGGTLYRATEEGTLQFEIMRTDSLGIAIGGAAGVEIPYPPISLYDHGNRPVRSSVVACAYHDAASVNIEDAYSHEGFDFSLTREFDQINGYRSRSFLTVPMKNHEDRIIGVLQLLNARDPATGDVVAFSTEDQRLVESLASQAAIALTNRQLIDHLELLFESFINLINVAIDEKSPYTGGHCDRVPVLTMMLAEAADGCRLGRLESFSMNEKDRHELKIAGLLHDCGKVTTPVHVVDKATKLETIYDRIATIETRFEVVRRDAEIEMLRARLDATRTGDTDALDRIERRFETRLRDIDNDRAFLRYSNIGSEAMKPEDQERVREISKRYRWREDDAEEKDFLSPDEIENLTIRSGTLTETERRVIDHHIVATIQMLESLPWPRHLKNVPEYAGSHHERMDGKGYPRGLKGDQMSVQARCMAIADIFEALTAGDRPYKKANTLSESLRILGKMRLRGHVDPDLFDVFVREKVYLRYAERYLDPEQIDEVDPYRIPGYRAG